ncbi:MDR family MFS transporter [Paenibacillus hexagrammi]|uniref:Multidrug efflux MFS transporter n=1 Tax=Paenibacillus hexagrammi TaxID=2908839 RepID=A0ABY3SS02_9BACL|nr:MDR family MFS transporter [Paenibacillus sp. YPD9-1]UJF35757.1 multidrug efflux MFS transporter [Paenibacillus sp. YPD9-1]
MENKESIPSYNRVTLVAILLAGTFVALLNQTLMNTAIPQVMKDLNITPGTAQWLTTVFMLINGIMIPVSAFLIERFSTRRLFLTAITIFAFGTIVGGFAHSFPMLMAGRVIQASGAGVMMPLMQTVFLIIFPKEKRGQVMGMVGLAIAFAPAIGPTLSGWLLEHYSWRVLFYVLFPIAVIDLIAAALLLKNVTRLTNPKVDIPSIILSSFGFGGLLFGFSNAGDMGWGSAQVLISLLVGAVALFFFIARQLKMERPMLEFRIFGNFIFTLTTILTMIVFMAMIAAELLLPMYMQEMRGYSSLQSGLMLLPGAIVMGIMNPIGGKIFDRYGARGLAIIGFSIVTVTTFMMYGLSISTPYAAVMLIYAVRMLGISMVMMPVTTAGLNQIPQHLIPHASAMGNTMRMMAGSIGTAILVTVMTATSKQSAVGHAEAMIHGVNNAFMVSGFLALAGLIGAFFIKKRSIEKSGKTAAPVPATET